MQEFLPVSSMQNLVGKTPSADQALAQQFHEAVTCANPKPLYQAGELCFFVEGLVVAVERSAEDGSPCAYTFYYQCRTSTGGAVMHIRQKNDLHWYHLCRTLSLPVEPPTQTTLVPRTQQEMHLADHIVQVIFCAARFLELWTPDAMRSLTVETLPVIAGTRGRWRVSFGSRICEVHWRGSGDYIAREWQRGDETAGVLR